MKISEVNLKTVKEYLRIDDDSEDAIVYMILHASISYISKYTGIPEENLGDYEDLTDALFVLCSDMYDNRQMTVENGKVNKVVQSILDMHCRNLL